jgi:hypothetical protein
VSVKTKTKVEQYLVCEFFSENLKDLAGVSDKSNKANCRFHDTKIIESEAFVEF